MAKTGTRTRTPSRARKRERAPQRKTGQASATSAALSYLVLSLFALACVCAIAWWRLPLWVAPLYGVLSAICFVVYAIDKYAATYGRWRTPESTLLALGLIGGWPGAILAQQWLRHKSVKTSFRIRFWCSVALNMAALIVLARLLA